MLHTLQAFAIHCIALCALLRAAAGSSNVTTMKFPADDGEVVDAILTPSSDAPMRSKSEENAKKVTFASCKPGTSCESMLMDYPCDQLKSMMMAQEPLMILIHGFGGSMKTSPACSGVMKAYMGTGKDMNVLMVDWAPLAAIPNYGNAQYGAITVGEVLPRLIHHFVEDCKVIALKDVHIIGFSLGAHAAGHAGMRYRELYGQKIGRITGLDPAGPGYKGTNPDNRLDPTDADYVDVIHTNGCSAWKGCFGIPDKCGHADFYPNGGTSQPGCHWTNIGCDHRRVVDLYMESVASPGSFRSCCYKSSHGDSNANNCKNGQYNTMGRYSTAKGGVYCYCNTNKKSKFSLSGDGRAVNSADRLPVSIVPFTMFILSLKFALVTIQNCTPSLCL